ncbi:MAG TPA: hypothetical protein VJT75_19250 [Thermoleophilaceae bacterium]|nr:hypothetical protein [Thermoleophilaceae bacterium]
MRGQRGRDVALVAGAGLAMLAILVAVRDGITDDGYITLAYAKNLALHLHWGLIPQETANTATSPLNVLLLGAITAVTRVSGDAHPVIALAVLSVGLAMVLAWGWLRIARALELPFWSAVAGTALVIVDPFLLSSIGLEVLLIAALLIVMMAAAVEERPALFGVVVGLALLARLDMILFALLIAAAAPALRARWLRIASAALLTCGPWFLLSWIALGSAIPDTLVIKLATRSGWGGWSYLTGPGMYAETWPAAAIVTFAPAALGAVLLGWWIATRGWRSSPRLVVPAAVGVGGLVYYAVYSALNLDPFHWYYVPPTVALTTFLVIGAGVLAERAGPVAGRLRPGATAATLALLFVVARLAVDVAHGLPWGDPLVSTNWATPGEYARVGSELRARVRGATVAGPGEIGALAYFCDCPIVDEFSDRGRAAELIDDAIGPKSNLAKRWLLKLNYAWWDADEPRPVAYRLRYDLGPSPRRDSWQVSTRWQGTGHLTLLRVR